MSQQINLFNPIFLQQKKIFSTRTMAQALGMLVVGLLALHAYASMQVAALGREADSGAAQLAAREARLATVTADFVPRQKNPALEGELAEAERELAALRRVSGVLQRGELGKTGAYTEYFRALARQHRDGLWLTGVTISGAGLGMRGRALDPRRVPAYLDRLTLEPIMQGKDFGGLSITRVGTPAPEGDSSTQAGGAAPYVEFSLGSQLEASKP